ncbi:tRNA(Ile)-lysidine synthetase [Xenococcus sp. PCC 7305]|uniref:tRNA lysidine(34) synthetase TilS n=1 Tax=Xenococcus sp. PCC 7305 TaxID=102125 RepID=UPI0002ABE3D0|nr:tRNA lysidine(34) synthetase TilS [Xenococcus sp. PCC 7305]ELS02885.1 tRNA(Ile)-lysidine synthetase [Xenococcus sp. PCC 7305]
MVHQNIWTNFHAKLHQTLRDQPLLPPQSRILVAVSGGQDSLCLSKLLLDLQSKWYWHIAIAHCDHAWATDMGIAAHVEKISQTWSTPFYLKQAHNLKETEAAARQWRYQALIEIAQENDFQYIVTGHTKSDRAETFLYNLIRGAGADGLSSLGWQRNLTPDIQLIRPILNFTRSETFDFCQKFYLPIWFDIANENNKYARNRIRGYLIPYLKDNFNPQVENSLVQTAELLRADTEYLETIATELLAQVKHPTEHKLNRQKLKAISLALQRRIIRQFLPQVIQHQPNFEQIEAVCKLISAPNKSRTSSLPNNAIAEAEGEWIVFYKGIGNREQGTENRR